MGFSRENRSKLNVTYYVSFTLRNAKSRSEHVGATSGRWNVAALERSDNGVDRDHAFAVLKRGYPRRLKERMNQVRAEASLKE
jgi:hypothetical protein